MGGLRLFPRYSRCVRAGATPVQTRPHCPRTKLCWSFGRTLPSLGGVSGADRKLELACCSSACPAPSSPPGKRRRSGCTVHRPGGFGRRKAQAGSRPQRSRSGRAVRSPKDAIRVVSQYDQASSVSVSFGGAAGETTVPGRCARGTGRVLGVHRLHIRAVSDVDSECGPSQSAVGVSESVSF